MAVVVITDQTLKGADVAMRALEIGAVDVMTKPGISNALEIEESRISLVDKVRSAYYAKRTTRKPEAPSPFIRPAPRPAEVKVAPRLGPVQFSSQSIIVVGASTGGTEAVREFLEVLPDNMPPILVVQHMPEKFTASFAKRLDELCALRVKEAEDGEAITGGTVYIAPGNQHMAIRGHQGKYYIKNFSGDLVNRHRPSVNVLFHSVAEVKAKHAVAIMMTGMGDDGATGMLALHQRGAYTIAQDESSCVVFGMPQKAILAGGVSKILPLQDISKEVCERIGVAVA
jgi:two-component system chemotaxis response regulator CheB